MAYTQLQSVTPLLSALKGWSLLISKCAYTPWTTSESIIANAVHTKKPPWLYTMDQVPMTQSFALSYMDSTNNCLRMLFSDVSSAFSTIRITSNLAKNSTNCIYTSLCSWILDFLMDQFCSLCYATISP